jgi:aspartate/tyrosine/aromatic aminotransferase
MTLDEEFLRDEEENRREIAFIREQLPGELKEKFTDNELLFMIDAIGTYFYTSGILESNDEEVDIDMEQVSDFVCKEAKEEGEGPFDAQEVFFVVQADLDFQEQNV